MGLSTVQRLAALEEKVAKKFSSIEMSIKFQVWEKTGPTRIESPAYGGLWSPIEQNYIAPCKPKVIPISQATYDIIMDEEVSHTELTGGRAGAKSITAAAFIAKKSIQLPFHFGILAAPTYEHDETVYEYLKKFMWDQGWIFEDVRDKRRVIVLWNGHKILWRSTTQNKALRSKSAAYVVIDECQDVKTNDVGALCGSVRIGSETDFERGIIVESEVDTQVLEAGTIKVGDFHDRHREREELGSVKQCRVIYKDNPWVSTKFIEQLRASMSDFQFKIEVLGDWRVLVLVDGRPMVFPTLDKGIHTIADYEIKLNGWSDITRLIVKRRCGVAYDYIAGADYNNSYPHRAVIHKVYKGEILHAFDEVLAMGHGGHLGHAMKNRGYTPENTFVVDDLSGRNKSTYDSEKAPSDRLLEMGYSLAQPGKAKNPSLKNTVDSLMYLIDPPPGGQVRFFVSVDLIGKKIYDLGKERLFNGLWDDFMECQWEGNQLYKPKGSDPTHGPDCCRYVAHYFWPPAKAKPSVRRVRQVATK